jgi:hypothetical protein
MLTAAKVHKQSVPLVLRATIGDSPAAIPEVDTPANWARGEDVIVLPSVSAKDAKKAFPQGGETPKPYIRVVSLPT